MTKQQHQTSSANAVPPTPSSTLHTDLTHLQTNQADASSTEPGQNQYPFQEQGDLTT